MEVLMKKGFKAVSCLVCEKMFEKREAEIRRYPNHCCSKECRSKGNNKRVKRKCDNCGSSVIRPPSLFGGKKNIFCGKECADEYQTKKQQVVCDYCGVIFGKQRSIIKRSRHNFCSTSCSSRYVHKTSFIEAEFENLIKNLGIKYSRNDRTIIPHLELDFYFPDYKYAVEINGKAHYFPIYGEDILAAQKKRDSRKRKRCKSEKILLRVVKPGNCVNGTYMKRLKRVVWELKKHVFKF